MSSAGMNLRSWTSNSKAFRIRVAADNVLDSDVIVKILGMRWDPTKDEMSFAERNIQTSSPRELYLSTHRRHHQENYT